LDEFETWRRRVARTDFDLDRRDIASLAAIGEKPAQGGVEMTAGRENPDLVDVVESIATLQPSVLGSPARVLFGYGQMHRAREAGDIGASPWLRFSPR
jgi:hypothetical protein